ncbi:hypothetical protein [Paracoccus sp. (in: a-proteobacteria)]|uniref:hypothetical protein n=1 Tax=Paracoccus sp. TaxID=267 RepID=UPI003220261B
MRALFLTACAVLMVAGCEEPAPQEDTIIVDQNRCSAAGFKPGSPEMASCMQTASTARQQQANREQRASDAAAKRRQVDDQIRAEDDAADRAAWDKRLQDSRDEAARMMSGQQQGFSIPDMGGGSDDNDGFNQPTAAGIPGMNCDGVGADQRCDALSAD